VKAHGSRLSVREVELLHEVIPLIAEEDSLLTVYLPRYFEG